MPYFFSLRRPSRSMMLPSKMRVEMRRAFQMLTVGIAIHHEDVGAAAGRDLAEFVPAELKRIVVGGRGQRLARARARRAPAFQARCAWRCRAWCPWPLRPSGQVMRVSGEDGLVDAPQPHGRLIGFFALAFFHPALPDAGQMARPGRERIRRSRRCRDSAAWNILAGSSSAAAGSFHRLRWPGRLQIEEAEGGHQRGMVRGEEVTHNSGGADRSAAAARSSRRPSWPPRRRGRRPAAAAIRRE